jgi:N-acetylglucosaminyldiphosphoundecaprenol N-acetyl-beta-D-mannosaminyltransferase
MALARTNILGVGVSAINMDLALETIRGWIERREQHFVTVTGVHGVMESQRDEKIRDIHNRAGMVTPDGMPLVWLSRLKGQSHVRRVYGPDLMLAVCQDGLTHGYRHYLYGGAEGVPTLLASKLRERFPGIQIVGEFSPPFRALSPEEDEQIVRDINAAQPDIVWVGLSTPKQERWMAAHVGRVEAPVMVGVGAAFDFHAGLKKQAPRWVQGSGMEWFFRLVTEPRRLAKRYLINNPTFLALIAAQLLGLRKYTLPE